MNNKGTQALFCSDVNVVREIPKTEVSVSVSTPDIEGVKKLNLSLDSVLPPMVDIPYDKADQQIKAIGGERKDLRYKWYTLANLLYMFLQIPLSLFSVLFFKIGLRPFYRGEVIKCVSNSDLVISHSDENFKETASLLPLNPIWVITWWSMLLSRTFEIIVARSLGKHVVMFPNSVGPFRTWLGRFLAKLSLNNCDTVLIRETISYDIVKRLEIRGSKILTYDTALLYTPTHNVTRDDFLKPSLEVCPGIYSRSLSKKETENYIDGHAKALDTAIEKYALSVVFIPHYISGFPHDDLDVSKLILDKMENKHQAKIVIADGVKEFKMYLDQMDMIISSKMHPAILGATGYVPILCIVYDHKQSSFFERLDMVECTLGVRLVSYQNLLSKIDYVWQQREQLSATLREQIPKWQKNVSEAIKSTVIPYMKINHSLIFGDMKSQRDDEM